MYDREAQSKTMIAGTAAIQKQVNAIEKFIAVCYT